MRKLSQALLLTTLLTGADAALAQNYDLSWSTIDAGGVMWSTAGGWDLSGTIGQPDAQVAPVMAGGDWELAGGFWPIAVPAFAPGDMNCDGAVNGQDIDGFIYVLFGTPPYTQYYEWTGGGCNYLNADMNGDGVVNGQDIDGFVAALFGG